MNNQELLQMVPIDFGGGCSLSKADLMSYLIKKEKIRASIDIGVYRGRSLLPQANTHKQYTGGIVYGVDPYDNKLVIEKDNKELKKQIDKFVEENDFNIIYKEVISLLKKTGLSNSTKIIRKTSSDAIDYFTKNSIKPRLIHIDGNHDKKIVLDDVQNYSKILAQDGIIVMDDVSWSSVKPAVDWLENNGYSLLFCRVDSLNDYAVFTNNKSVKKNKKLSANLFQFGQY